MLVIGIAGPSGAGKTALCKVLASKLPNCNILQQDWYFKDPDILEEDAIFTDPQFLHVDEFVAHFLQLVRGERVSVPLMDMRTFRRTEETRNIEPGDFLIVEGMTIFRIPEVFMHCHCCIYLSPGMGAIRRRKWLRDRRERGKSPATIRKQLLWVESEYIADLEAIETSERPVLVIRQALPIEQVAARTLAYVKECMNYVMSLNAQDKPRASDAISASHLKHSATDGPESRGGEN